jgi:hypothetical protein
MKATLLLISGLFIGSISAQTLPSYIPTDNLIAWYSFSSNANDLSGNNYHSLSSEISYSVDRHLDDLSALDLSSNVVQLPGEVFNFTREDSFTVSFWFTNENSTSNKRLISTENPEGNFRITSGQNDSIQIQFGDYDVVHLTNPTEWNHIVYIFNGSVIPSNREELIYINGRKLIESSTHSHGDINDGTLNYGLPLALGAKASRLVNDRWKGKFDDFGIWKQALSEEEVLKIYNQSNHESIYAGKVKNNTSSGESLFFSEFITGTEFNKAFEIFNPFDDPVDLSNYLVLGNTNSGAFIDTLSFPPGTMLSPQDVYVVAHSQSMSEIQEVSDTLLSSNMISFDGNDTRVLVRIDGADLTLLDVFGSVHDSPEIGWTTYGEENATATHVLTRKNFIGRGNPIGLDTFGAEEPWWPYITGEWYVSSPNNIGSIGFHHYLNITNSEENILLNGDFESSNSIGPIGSDSFTFPLSGIGNTVSGTEDLNPWYSQHAQDKSIVSHIKITDGELAFTELDGSRHPYDTQAGQYINSSQLTKGKKYEISFDAYSSQSSHGIHVFLGQVGKGWTRYLESAYPSYNASGNNIGSGDVFLDTLKQNYSLVFQADTIWSVMKLSFEVDTKPGDVYIDNVVLKQVADDTPTTVANPIRVNPPLVRIDTALTIGSDFTLSIYTDGIESSFDIESFNVSLNYPKNMKYEGHTTEGTLANNGILEINNSESRIEVGFASNNIISGNDPLIKLQFSSMTGEDYPVNLDEVVFNNIISNNNQNGLIGVIGALGDVDNDGRIFAFDAARVLKYSIGLDPLPEEDPLPWDFWRLGTADVNFDEMILASDASEILQYSVGLRDEFVPFKGKQANPEVVMYASDKELRFESLSQGLFAMNIEFTKTPGMVFAEPMTLEGVLMASNVNDTTFKLAVASSEDLTGNFLSIPINAIVGDEVITVDYFMNNVKGQHNVDMSSWLTANEGLLNKPKEFELNQNYPNPFNPTTNIQYALPVDAQVSLVIYNALGQKVMELVNGQKSAGYHTATFDASGLSSGVYLYRLTTPSFTQTKKMLLIK